MPRWPRGGLAHHFLSDDIPRTCPEHLQGEEAACACCTSMNNVLHCLCGHVCVPCLDLLKCEVSVTREAHVQARCRTTWRQRVHHGAPLWVVSSGCAAQSWPLCALEICASLRTHMQPRGSSRLLSVAACSGGGAGVRLSMAVCCGLSKDVLQSTTVCGLGLEAGYRAQA